MNGNPTAAQKRFHESCRGMRCIIGMGECDALHHIRGAKMKLKGVTNAGEWFLIPISYWWHQDGNNKNAIHINRAAFYRATGRAEKEYWIDLMNDYHHCFGKHPMSEEEYQIIVDRA